MSESLQHFKTLIRNANYDNTYKMAWAKAIVEYSFLHKNDEQRSDCEEVEITLKEIGSLMIKYYWNQTIFFNLIQGSNIKKPPLILQKVQELIEEYYLIIGEKQPSIFERAVLSFETTNDRLYQNVLKRIPTILKQDVSYRFLRLSGAVFDDVYRYERGDDSLFIKRELLNELAENHEDIFDLINYRWSLILETFNSSPRINKKVRIIDEREIRRSPLKSFDKYLDYENPEHMCFICGKRIESEKDLSRDHVIPWSYLYSDDLWNLVYVHKTCNSTKSNIIPQENDIKRIKERNIKLLKVLEDNGVKGKELDELRIAIEKNYIDHFYVGIKG